MRWILSSLADLFDNSTEEKVDPEFYNMVAFMTSLYRSFDSPDLAPANERSSFLCLIILLLKMLELFESWLYSQS